MVDATLTVAPLAPIAAPLSKMKPPELAKAINEKVAQMNAGVRTTVQRAIEIGELLMEAKKRVGHGKFEKWRNDHCQLSPATARRCMELAEQRPELEKQLSTKTLNLSDLNLTAARRAERGAERRGRRQRLALLGAVGAQQGDRRRQKSNALLGNDDARLIRGLLR